MNFDNSLKVSISIPCRNEEKYIAKCLDSIINCDYPKDKLKVFVSDGLSDDNTIAILLKYEKKFSFIKMLVNEKKTTQFALNLGLKAADADIKIILGAHSEISPDYIKKCVNAFQISEEIGCVGGILENVIEDEVTSVISKAMSSSFGVGNAHFRTGNANGYVDTVAFGAYKKEVFEKIGYFDEDLVRNQDDEFNFRVLKNGFKIYLSQKIKSKYYVRASFKKLYKQYYQYGYWKVYVNTKHKTVTTLRQIVPAAFVVYLFGGLLTSFLINKLMPLYLFGLIIYLVFAFIFASKKSEKLAEMLKIVFTFFILHFSYVIGYLEGIVNFVLLSNKPKTTSSELSR